MAVRLLAKTLRRPGLDRLSAIEQEESLNGSWYGISVSQ